MNRSDRRIFAEQWSRQDSANFTCFPAFGKLGLRLRGRYVMDMNRLFIEHSFSNKSTAGHRSSFLWSEYPHRSIRSDKPKRIPVSTPNCRVGRITQPGGIFGNYIQHRLNVCWRAGDHTEDFTRRCLLLERLPELSEQPHVLKGDDRLVGKRLEELDLRRSEGVDFSATCVQRTDKFPLLPKRHG